MTRSLHAERPGELHYLRIRTRVSNSGHPGNRPCTGGAKAAALLVDRARPDHPVHAAGASTGSAMHQWQPSHQLV